MKKLSISSIMIVVFCIALGLAALRVPSRFWASALLTLESSLLMSSVIGVVLFRGRDRATCLGFALFGLYQVVTLSMNSSSFSSPLRTMVIDYITPYVNPSMSKLMNPKPPGSGPSPPFSPEELAAYIHIMNHIGIIAFSSFGAILGRLLFLRAAHRNSYEDGGRSAL